MNRYACIDIGTNSVLLLVAQRDLEGKFLSVIERAEITRLGKGVDLTRTLTPQSMEDTLRVLTAFAAEAKALGATKVLATATSAARDATNGAEFLQQARARTGLTVEIISGDEEARLSFAAAQADFAGTGPLVVMDIGGGSTEIIYGDPTGAVQFRHSFDVGSVRLTERFFHADPPPWAERSALVAHLRDTFSQLPLPPPNSRLVGLAGTVTTVCAVARGIEPYDATRIHGATLSLDEVSQTVERLAALNLSARQAVPGLQPKRADVIVAGAQLLLTAMQCLKAPSVTVSDRGLRWGLLADRFGGAR